MTFRTYFRPSAARRDDQLIEDVVSRGVHAAHGPGADRAALDQVVLVLTMTDPAVDSAGRLAAQLGQAVARLHRHSWLPADVLHVVGREWTARVRRLAGLVLVHHASTVSPAPPGEWATQLAGLGPDPGPGVVAAFRRREGLDADDAWRDGLRLLALLLHLPPLEALAPEPTGPVPTHAVEPRVLARVRALLAKAESTTFPEEADALTAKAQDLISRHALDEAVLEARAGTGAEVVARRVHVDNPYAAAKAQLLDAVGRVNDVRLVWTDALGMATVVGHPHDLDRTELLFTSLLVQATRALAVATREVSAKSFRRAFLLAYALRIGERLEQVRDGARGEAEQTYGAALVPVLAERSEAVEHAFNQMFPRLRTPRRTRVDALGWHAGRAAADEAELRG